MRLKNMKRLIGAAVAVCSIGAATSAHAAVITAFSFDTYTVPTAPGNAAVGVFTGPASDSGTGTGSFSANHAASSTYSTPAGNGTAKAFSSTTWSNGDYYQFTSTQAATPGLELEFAQVSSGTGPTSFAVQYSTDGTNFINLAGGGYTVSTSLSFSGTAVKSTNPPTYLFDFTGMTDIESATSLTFRLVDTGATSAAGGTDRIDTVTLGTALPAPTPLPEPASISLLASGGLMLFRRRK